MQLKNFRLTQVSSTDLWKFGQLNQFYKNTHHIEAEIGGMLVGNFELSP